MKRTLLILLVLLVLGAAGWYCVTWIPAGTVAVETTQGRLQRVGPSLEFHAPSWRPEAVYPLSIPPIRAKSRPTFFEGGVFTLDFEVSGKIDPNGALLFHEASKGTPVGVLRVVAERALAEAAATRYPRDLLSGELEKAAASRAGAIFATVGGLELTLRVLPLEEATLLELAQWLGPRKRAGVLRGLAEQAVAREGSGWQSRTVMGLVLDAERDLQGAEKMYLDALTFKPDALPPMAQLVEIYLAVGETARLDRILEAALQADPNSVQHMNWAAISMMRQNRLDEADQMIAHALRLDASNPLLLNNLAGLRLKEGRPEEALSVLRQAAEQNPGDRQTLFNLGSALLSMNRGSEALAPLLAAEKLGAPSAALLRAIASSLKGSGRGKEAAEYERRIRELEPPDSSRTAANPTEPTRVQ